MSPRSKGGRSSLERLHHRYERTDTRCTACGYVDEDGNWESATDGSTVVYHHVCPSCGAERDHTFNL